MLKSFDTNRPAVIVTRHESLARYLREVHAAPEEAEVKAHVTADDVRGREVWGVLPLHLAVLAARVMVLDLDIPAELRGQELTREQLQAYDRGLTAYVVAPAEQIQRLADQARAANRELSGWGIDIPPGY